MYEIVRKVLLLEGTSTFSLNQYITIMAMVPTLYHSLFTYKSQGRSARNSKAY